MPGAQLVGAQRPSPRIAHVQSRSRTAGESLSRTDMQSGGSGASAASQNVRLSATYACFIYYFMGGLAQLRQP